MAVTNIEIKRNISNRSLQETFRMILDDFSANSEKTARAYRNVIRDFLDTTIGKTMDNVTWEEFLAIDYDKVLAFKNDLINRRDIHGERVNSNKTINYKLTVLGGIYKELNKVNPSVDISVAEVRKLKKLETNDEGWGSLTESEVNNLIDWCYHGEGIMQKHLIKARYFETAYITALRVNCLLNLKWGNIKLKEDKNGNSVRVIVAEDKGKIVHVAISDSFYERLCELKKIEYPNGHRNQKTDKIFQISDKALSRTLKKFCELAGIGEDRKIVLHSLKKSSIDKVYQETKDINVTARHAQHSTTDLIYKVYQGKNSDYSDMPSVRLFDATEGDIDALRDMSKDELLELIDMAGRDVVSKLVLQKKRLHQ